MEAACAAIQEHTSCRSAELLTLLQQHRCSLQLLSRAEHVAERFGPAEGAPLTAPWGAVVSYFAFPSLHKDNTFFCFLQEKLLLQTDLP